MTQALSLPIVFLAGLLSFASPCFLPVVPVFVGYLAGESTETNHTYKTLRQSIVFVAAFSVVFIALWLFIGSFGAFFSRYRTAIRIIAGIILVVMGLVVARVIRIPGLERTFGPAVTVDTTAAPSYRRSAVLGLAFGAGWTPCIGPVLSGIIALAATTGSLAQGSVLMVIYCIGLGLPFILVAVGANWFITRLDWVKHHHRGVEITAGVLLVATGLMVIANLFVYLSALMPWSV